MLSTLLIVALHTGTQAPLAVLDDGTRLQVSAEVQVGAFTIETAHGRFRSQGQKVVEILDATAEIQLLENLHDLDIAAWAQRLSERGLIERLLVEPVTEENRAILFEALEPWGQRIDPLPQDTKRDLRVRVLWERIKKTSTSERALLVGALRGEITQTRDNVKRRVGLKDWRAAMTSKDAGMRWTAAMVASSQRDSDMEVLLMETALTDESLWVAWTCGVALLDTDPRGALHRWSYELVTDRQTMTKQRAALMLGELGTDYGDLALETAGFIRSGKGTLYLGGGSIGGSTGSGSGCEGAAAAFSPGSGGGKSVTEGSVLELRAASATTMLTVADVLERVATAGTHATPHQEMEVQGEITPASTEKETEATRSDAWRRYLMTKNAKESKS